MTSPDGTVLTCEQVLERVRADGAFVVFRDSVAMPDRGVWRARLRRIAGAQGMRLTIRDLGGVVLISDGSRADRAGQMAVTLGEVLDEDTAATPAPDPRWNHPSRGAHLRLVRGSQ